MHFFVDCSTEETINEAYKKFQNFIPPSNKTIVELEFSSLDRFIDADEYNELDDIKGIIQQVESYQHNINIFSNSKKYYEIFQKNTQEYYYRINQRNQRNAKFFNNPNLLDLPLHYFTNDLSGDKKRKAFKLARKSAKYPFYFFQQPLNQTLLNNNKNEVDFNEEMINKWYKLIISKDCQFHIINTFFESLTFIKLLFNLNSSPNIIGLSRLSQLNDQQYEMNLVRQKRISSYQFDYNIWNFVELIDDVEEKPQIVIKPSKN